MEKDSKGKGIQGGQSGQSSQKGGLPKKTKPAGDSLSLPPASTERLSGQDGQLSSATGDTPKQGCRQKGRKRSRADKEDRRLPKKTETGGESPSIPPASKTGVASPGGEQTPGRKSSRHTDVCPDPAVPSTSQTSVDFCPQDTSSSEDTLSESTETEGQSDTEVLEQEPAQQPARMKMTNKGNAKQNIQALSVNIFKDNNHLKDLAARTNANLERACPQGYVRTRSYSRALSVVTKQGTCILTGSSGSGKTTLARHLLLHFKDQGFLPLELISPEECQFLPWRKVSDKKCKQKVGDEKGKHKVSGEKFKLVLLVDNVLGTGNYEDELRRKWGKKLEAMRPYIDQGHVKVILASRANIYAQIRGVKGSRELLQEAPEVAVGGGDCQLTDWEKTGILERVLSFHKVKLPTQVSTEKFISASKETVKLGYPQMCVHLATNKNALSNPVVFVQNPVPFLNDEFSQLRLNDQMSYYVLILVLLKEGILAESFLKDPINKAFMSQVAEMVGLSVPPGYGKIQELAEHLSDSYLEYNSQSSCFSFSHDSIWDCLFTNMCKMDFDKAVQVCTWKQLVLYVRTDPKSENKEDCVYLVPKAYWPFLAKRLLLELTCGDADLACSHPCLQHPDFVTWLREEFLTSENPGGLLGSMHKKMEEVEGYQKSRKWVVTQCQKIYQRGESSFSSLYLCGSRTSAYEVNIFTYHSPISSLLLRKSSLAKHILESAQFLTLSPPTQSQILTEALTCALYVSDSGLVDWLLHRGARVTEECVRAACCAEQEHVGLVERALQWEWEGVLSAGTLTEMARVASQMDRPRTLELVLSHLPRSESTQAELDLILAELILITHPREGLCRKLSQLAHMVRALKKAGAQFKSHIDQFTAAGHLDPSALSEWLEQIVDFSATDENANTLLHHAAQYGALSNVQTLLGYMDSMSQHDQLVNARNRKGRSALHLAAGRGHFPVVECPLDGGACVNAKDRCSTTPLHLASNEVHTSTVELLVTPKASVNAQNILGKTALHFALEKGKWDTAELLMHRGADKTVTTMNEDTVLHSMAASNSQAYIRSHRQAIAPDFSLVESLGDLTECKNNEGDTPIMVAVKCKNWEVLLEMLKLQYDLSVTDREENTALHLALMQTKGVYGSNSCRFTFLNDEMYSKTRNQCISVMVEKCAKHLNIQNIEGDTPLMLAVRSGNTFAMKEILKCQLDLDLTVRGKGGNTILHEVACNIPIEWCAAADGSVRQVVESLIGRCADLINCPNDDGDSPILTAARKARWVLLSLLLKQKCDVRTCDKRGNTLLHCLAKYTPPEKLETRARAVIGDLAETVDSANEDGNTALMLAADSGNVWMVRELLELQCNVRLTNKHGETALYLAARNGHFTVMEILLGQDDDISIQTNEGNTVLHALADCWHLKFESRKNEAVRRVVRSLVEKGRSVVNCQNSIGETPLYFAIKNGNFLMMEMLLGQDADVSIQTKEGNTVLHVLADGWGLKLASRENDAVREVVRSVVGKGRPMVNCRNSRGETPLYTAIEKRNFHVMNMLLGQDADVSIKTKEGNTVFHALAACEDLEDEDRGYEVVREALRSVVEKGRGVVNCPNSSGETPLYISVENRNFLVIEMLGEDADASIKTKEGNTVLHALADCWDLKHESRFIEAERRMVRSLVEKGRSVVNCPNSSGETPLYIAIENRNFHVLEMLLGEDADVSIKTKEGNTVLHALADCWGLKYASRENDTVREVVRSLVEKGRGVVNCRNSRGETPLYTAIESRNFLVMEMLLGKDADVSIQTKEGNTGLHALATCWGLEDESRENDTVSEVVISLVEKCRSMVNHPNSSGENPLYLAFLYSNWHVAELLLEQDGSSADSTEGGLTDKPLETTDLSLAQGGASTPLHGLASSKDLAQECEDDDELKKKVAMWVKRFSHWINHQDQKGNTPILLALRKGNLCVAEQLLQCEADLSFTDADGGTVLHALAHLAISECEPELTEADKAVAVRVTELAQAAGVTPLTPNKKGKTAPSLLEQYRWHLDYYWIPYLFRLWQQE